MKNITQLILSLLIVGNISAQNLLQNLQACYPLDGNATNMASTGSALDGILRPSGNPPASTTDRFNNSSSALHFDGTNDMVELQHNSLIKPTQGLSFSAWFKFDSVPSLPLVQYLLFTKNTCGNNFEAYSLALAHTNVAAAGCYRFCFNKIDGGCFPASTQTIMGTTDLVPNKWYHVGCYAGEYGMRLFLDGVPEGPPNTTTSSVPIVYDTNNLSFYLGGSNETALPGFFKGSMDDVRFYDRELTSGEFYALKSALSCAATAPMLLNGLQACYPLNNNVTNYAPTATVPPSLNGIANNVASTTGINGVSNTAYKFSGATSSYIELPNDARIKPPTGLSFSAWVRVDVVDTYQYIVFAKNNCSSYFEGYSLVAEDAGGGNIRYLVEKTSSPGCSAGDYAVLTSSSSYPSGVWQHVAFYIDNYVIKLYVNGAQAQTPVSSNVVLNYANTKVILGGTNESVFNYPLNGKIDNVRFYDRELSAAEVSAIYTYDPSCDDDYPCGGNPSNCRPAVITGIADHSERRAEPVIFPNPTTGKLYIRNAKDKSLIIYDINGKVVQHSMNQKDEATGEINLTGSAEGLYFVKIIDSKGNVVQTAKIIVTH